MSSAELLPKLRRGVLVFLIALLFGLIPWGDIAFADEGSSPSVPKQSTTSLAQIAGEAPGPGVQVAQGVPPATDYASKPSGEKTEAKAPSEDASPKAESSESDKSAGVGNAVAVPGKAAESRLANDDVNVAANSGNVRVPSKNVPSASESVGEEATTSKAKSKDKPIHVAGKKAPDPGVELSGKAHVQDKGWSSKETVKEDQILTLGSTGKAKRLEAIELSVEGGSISYETHVQNIGWQSPKKDGELAGTTGKALRIEAVALNLQGEVASRFDIWYRAHVQNKGWMGWTSNGKSAGTCCMGLRLEALQIAIRTKGAGAPGSASSPYKSPSIRYVAHVQNRGWLDNASDGQTGGTTGKGLRLEAVQISIPDARKFDNQLGIAYRSHVQNVGWQGWVKDDATTGSVGKAQRLEAIQVKLTGAKASQYDVYYRIHAANIGWMGWSKNGESAGTSGAAVQLEALQIALRKKGGAAPSGNAVPSFLSPQLVVLDCGSRSQGEGSWRSVKSSKTAGTTGQSKDLLGIKVSANSDIPGGIRYRTHLANIGWGGWSSNGTPSGTLKAKNPVQAMQISLTGDLSKYFDVYYRAHVSDYGWMGWTKNGSSAGTTGMNMDAEAYQVYVTVKGGAAPGSTDRSFSDQNGFMRFRNYSPEQLYMYERAQGFSSDTDYLIMVDLDTCHLGIFEGYKGHWELEHYWLHSPGKPSTPTVRGTFETLSKKPQLSTSAKAIYCTQFYGGYFFHSILNSEDELGRWLSHGCVRVHWDNARWMYNHLPLGTRVNVY